MDRMMTEPAEISGFASLTELVMGPAQMCNSICVECRKHVFGNKDRSVAGGVDDVRDARVFRISV